ncbi:MAG: hypothetical protein HOB77_06800 [Campylobacteraceae bacterium]|jgi:hypothetical protein|nr:hypothetical protein [Campylobacteraceae bacterium]
MKYILIVMAILVSMYADIFTNKQKKEISQSVNLNYPVTIGEGTHLVNFSIINDTFMYMANVDYTSQFSNKEKIKIKKDTAMGICTDNRTLPGLKKGLHFQYAYRNADTYKVFYQFDLSIKDCR